MTEATLALPPDSRATYLMALKKSPTPVAVVTGAGSGVGRAAALKFAAEGWRVALIGRRPEALAETIALAPAAARKQMLARPCDLGDAAAVNTMAREVIKRFARVDALVNAAGNNIPKRALSDLSRADYTA